MKSARNNQRSSNVIGLERSNFVVNANFDRVNWKLTIQAIVPSFLFSDDIADGFVPANTCRC
jgi:hypothetical protein